MNLYFLNKGVDLIKLSNQLFDGPATSIVTDGVFSLQVLVRPDERESYLFRSYYSNGTWVLSKGGKARLQGCILRSYSQEYKEVWVKCKGNAGEVRTPKLSPFPLCLPRMQKLY
jgi:hypothetical protein